MKVVIELDSTDYMYIKNGCIVPIKIDNHIYDAIRGGTVLPKGHGRLYDEKVLHDYWGEKYDLLHIPCVVEADKEAKQ